MVVPLSGICAGGGPQGPSLPQPVHRQGLQELHPGSRDDPRPNLPLLPAVKRQDRSLEQDPECRGHPPQLPSGSGGARGSYQEARLALQSCPAPQRHWLGHPCRQAGRARNRDLGGARSSCGGGEREATPAKALRVTSVMCVAGNLGRQVHAIPKQGAQMLNYRMYSTGDLGSCVRLIQEGHAPEFTEERFRWLHEQAPGGGSAIALCEEHSAIVGIYSVIRKTVSHAGRLYSAGRDVDPVVHHDYRRRGVFTSLLRFGLEHFRDIAFYFNFANAASAPGFRRSGWRDVGALDDYVCQLGFERVVSRDFVRWLSTGAWVDTKAEGCEEVSCQAAHKIVRCLAPKMTASPDQTRIWVVRSIEYLNWRYFRNPLRREYRWFVEGAHGVPRSMVVGSVDNRNRRLTVLDLLDWSGEFEMRHYLACWSREFPGYWVGIWSHLPRRLVSGLVVNPLKRGSGWTFLVRAGSSGICPDGLFSPSRWWITRGDLEVS